MSTPLALSSACRSGASHTPSSFEKHQTATCCPRLRMILQLQLLGPALPYHNEPPSNSILYISTPKITTLIDMQPTYSLKAPLHHPQVATFPTHFLLVPTA
eukprot:c29792_g1_i1 orf=434-736(+)